MTVGGVSSSSLFASPCDERRKRFQSAQQMREQFARLCVPAPFQRRIPPKAGSIIVVVHQRNAQPDDYICRLLQTRLPEHHCQVVIDPYTSFGVQAARELETRMAQADAVITLLSETSIKSEMLAYEVEMAHDAAHRRQGKPSLLPVRLQCEAPLPNLLVSILGPLPTFAWSGPQDDERLLANLIDALQFPVTPDPVDPRPEPDTGPVRWDSRYYIARPVDEEFNRAVARRESLIQIQGARQMGKTSLLFRGLCEARANHLQAVFTDFQKFSTLNFETPVKFYTALCDSLADQLKLEIRLEDTWDPSRSNNIDSCFEQYLRRQVLSKVSTHLIWELDEVDRLFGCPFGSDVFRQFCGWQTQRFLDPNGWWERLTLVVAYVTEAHLFMGLEDLEAHGDRDEGIFGDHLRFLLFSLMKDDSLVDVVRAVLRGELPVPLFPFYRLRSAGNSRRISRGYPASLPTLCALSQATPAARNRSRCAEIDGSAGCCKLLLDIRGCRLVDALA